MQCGSFANCVPQFCVCTYTQSHTVAPLLSHIQPTYLVASGDTPLLDKGRPPTFSVLAGDTGKWVLL